MAIKRPVPGKAVEIDCPNGYRWNGKGPLSCSCKPHCAICGYPKHDALHGPLLGKEAGSEPWHHEYKPDHLYTTPKEPQ